MMTDRPGDAAREVAELEQVARTALTEVREAVSGYRQPTLEGELAGARMALSAAGIDAAVDQTRVPLDPAVEAVLAWTVREGATNVIRHSGARHCTLRVTASLSDAGVEVIDDGAAGDAAASGVGRGAGGAGLRDGAGGDAAASGGGGAGLRDGAGGDAVANGDGGDGDGADLRDVAVATRGVGSASPSAGSNGNGNDVSPHAGVGGRGPGGGHGIAGLAERARLVNGTIEAGALADGGYRLAVTVPVSHA
jgi:two-component system sensor histidine kinase DesK